ncbi:MAG TPA: DPP IV N-terminal domain-containing protein, partial [Vicinamibacteria bacterium]|nr:DPP IV N-terminal domain-containing protein [Vicinamibacteria bacterium]
MMHRAAWGFVILLFALDSSAQTKRLTIETIFGGDLSAPSPSQIRWMPDGRVSFFFPASTEGRDLVVFDPATGERHTAVGTAVLREAAPSPSEAGVDEREYTRRTRFGVPDYHWSPDGSRLLFTSTGKILVHELATHMTTPLAAEKRGVLDPKFSPDGTQIAFVYEHDLWVVPVGGGEEKQLTFGGTELILHGELDWVYPEELGVRSAYHWSPDSAHIAFLELDETLVPTYPLVDEVSRQATVDLQRYPKPGDPNPRVRVGFVSVSTGRTAWIDRAAEYMPRIQWVDGRTAAVQLLNRGQDELELVFADPSTGRSRTAAVEKDPYWLNVNDDLNFLGADRFVWTSERTGFRHVYLFEKGTSRAITSGEWEVSEIEGMDAKRGLLYFTANRDNPIGTDLYQVKLDGSGLECLTDGKGTHAVDMNPEATAYLDDFSSMNDPGRTVLRKVDGGRELPFHEEKPVAEYGLAAPEYRLLETPDGAKVGLLLLQPKELEAGKK